jgi:hypothetical protein
VEGREETKKKKRKQKQNACLLFFFFFGREGELSKVLAAALMRMDGNRQTDGRTGLAAGTEIIVRAIHNRLQILFFLSFFPSFLLDFFGRGAVF